MWRKTLLSKKNRGIILQRQTNIEFSNNDMTDTAEIGSQGEQEVAFAEHKSYKQSAVGLCGHHVK